MTRLGSSMLDTLREHDSSKLDRYLVFGLILTIPSIPFVRFGAGDFQIPLAFLIIGVYACLKLPVLIRDSKPVPMRVSITAMLAIYAAWSAASLLWATTTDLAASRLFIRICQIFFCILVINFCAVGLASVHRMSWLLPLAVLVVVLVGYFGYFTSTNPPHYQFSYEFPRFLGDRNSDTFMILTGLPFALAMLLTGAHGRLGSFLGLVAFVLMALAIFLSLSRANLLVMILVVSILVIADFVLRRGRLRSIMLVAALCVGLVVVVSLVPSDRFVQTITQHEKRFEELEDDTRWGLSVAALELAAEHPLTGVGLNNYPPEFHTTNTGRFWYRAERHKPVPHNSFLSIWAELGTPALALFTMILLWPLASVLRLAPRIMRSQDLLFIHLFLGSLGLSLVLIQGIMAYNFADIFYFWLVYAVNALIIVALDRALRHSSERSLAVRPFAKRGMLFGARQEYL
ncbi:MAG: O-antigen ligase family protein [Thermodesulfobacteriota bacterium]